MTYLLIHPDGSFERVPMKVFRSAHRLGVRFPLSSVSWWRRIKRDAFKPDGTPIDNAEGIEVYLTSGSMLYLTIPEDLTSFESLWDDVK